MSGRSKTISRVRELSEDIVLAVDYGECFYSKEDADYVIGLCAEITAKLCESFTERNETEGNE